MEVTRVGAETNVRQTDLSAARTARSASPVTGFVTDSRTVTTKVTRATVAGNVRLGLNVTVNVCTTNSKTSFVTAVMTAGTGLTRETAHVTHVQMAGRSGAGTAVSVFPTSRPVMAFRIALMEVMKLFVQSLSVQPTDRRFTVQTAPSVFPASGGVTDIVTAEILAMSTTV